MNTTIMIDTDGMLKFNKDIGIDFGVNNKLTLSNGLVIDFKIPNRYYEDVENLQIKLKNTPQIINKRRNFEWYKTKKLLNKKQQKLRIISLKLKERILEFLKLYRNVIIQDDRILNWKKAFGNSDIERYLLDEIKKELKKLPFCIMVKTRETTTNECFKCGRKYGLILKNNMINCSCNWYCDRDLNTSLVIHKKGLLNMGLKINKCPQLGEIERFMARWILDDPYIEVKSIIPPRTINIIKNIKYKYK